MDKKEDVKWFITKVTVDLTFSKLFAVLIVAISFAFAIMYEEGNVLISGITAASLIVGHKNHTKKEESIHLDE